MYSAARPQDDVSDPQAFAVQDLAAELPKGKVDLSKAIRSRE
jgi:hypothetical protein